MTVTKCKTLNDVVELGKWNRSGLLFIDEAYKFGLCTIKEYSRIRKKYISNGVRRN